MYTSYLSPIFSYCENSIIKRTGICTGPPPTLPSIATPTASPNTVKTYTPTAMPSLAPTCVQDGPTSWMSVSTPTPYNQGDVESIEKLRQQYVFCGAGQMRAIECRIVGTTRPSAASGQAVFCDLMNGLKCYHSNQKNGELCLNYEVRITCDCGK